MKKRFIPAVLFLFIACKGEVENADSNTETPIENNDKQVEVIDEENQPEDEVFSAIDEITTPVAAWKDLTVTYDHFNFDSGPMDTVYIGVDREWTSLSSYFSETRNNVVVLVEPGRYFNYEVGISGENIILKALGDVSLICETLHDNVMWVHGNNIVIDNFHMTHRMPGEAEDQNCSGRVLGFDGADNITVVNCDLNGCGLAGLHDNLGNGIVYVEHNYIHNNSLGAYTDIDGNVWQEETDHPVFKFRNNLIEDNGHLYDEPWSEDY